MTPSDEPTFASSMKAARARAGISQRALAALANITQATVSRIESGLFEPRISTALKIADALDTPVGDLIEGSNTVGESS